jgi:polysaccharide export outer membrane protein
MPLIQDVTAEGQTAAELATQIQQKLTAFIKEPQVSVIVLQINAPKFYVIGNVVRPGTYPLRGETSVLQALSLAGGFTQFASPRSIKLIRNTNGKQEVRKVNYNNLIDEGGEGNFLLKSGDTIVVP